MPIDFAAITGIRLCGFQIPWDFNIRDRLEYICKLLGWITPASQRGATKLSEIWNLYYTIINIFCLSDVSLCQ